MTDVVSASYVASLVKPVIVQAFPSSSSIRKSLTVSLVVSASIYPPIVKLTLRFSGEYLTLLLFLSKIPLNTRGFLFGIHSLKSVLGLTIVIGTCRVYVLIVSSLV
ncbi:hypothetical protein AAEU42_03190 [Pseudoflavonifractor phocaeensis]|uniref:hypothetical protein n=1 Tax=Pseudoflavonifractor phocaeensis TaxID=1870988 RepID=UPI00313C60E5